MNKTMLRITAFMLIICTLFALSCGATELTTPESAVQIDSIKAEGFAVEDFAADNTYYLVSPVSFEDIRFTEIKTNIDANVNINVERYCDYNYTANYGVGDKLNLGYGRARVTVTVTSKTTPLNTKRYLFAFTDPAQSGYRYRRFAAATTVYTSAATTSAKIGTLQKGTTNSTMPLCIATQGDMTKIVIPSGYTQHHGKVGWVKTANLIEEYDAIPMPAEYTDAIAKLKAAHPDWTFEYQYMGVDMDDYAQQIVDLYHENTNKTTDVATVLKNMDPINFLDEKNVFMFLDVNRYNGDDFTEAGIKGLWSENKNAVITEAQATDYLLASGASLKINTYFIAARATLESGHGTSKLSKGIAGTDGRLYYNFYGIKAYDKNNQGAVYAEQRNWDSPFRSIAEGANWITDQYVHRGQNTPYFFRFYPYKTAHLYMSDLQAPQKDAASLYTCYKSADKLDASLHFVIPYYEFRYSDVMADKWYYEDVYRATEYKLFEGMTETEFVPDGTLTRAQLITVLSRISGADVTKCATEQFTDVAPNSWYANAIAWGYENGIVNGMSATTFEPNRPISRQDLCTMLSRYADAQKLNLPVASGLPFNDDDKIGGWAKEAVYRCVAAGLVNGMGGNRFEPRDNATRAQGAKILSLFYETYVLKTEGKTNASDLT